MQPNENEHPSKKESTNDKKRSIQKIRTLYALQGEEKRLRYVCL